MPTKRQIISYMLIRFLSFHNKLEGLVSFVAVWWGILTIIFHEFWNAWPVTAALTHRTYGHPSALSYILLISGVLGYWSKVRNWQSVRTICFIAMFVCWGILTVTFLSLKPIFAPGVACYSAFAIATLISYVSYQVGLEMVIVEKQLGNR